MAATPQPAPEAVEPNIEPAIAPPDATVEPRSALAIHDFRLLFTMQLMTGVRLPLQFFAQTWYINVTAPEDQRVLLLGLLATVRGAFFVLWVLFGGALADRFPRRTMLTITHVTGFAMAVGTGLVLLIPAASHGDGPWLWVMLLLFGELGLVDAQDLPTRNAMISNVVPARLRTSAMTLSWLAQSTTMLMMMPLAAWLIGVIGYGSMYLFASLGHIAVLVAVRRMRLRAVAADQAAAGESMIENVRVGLAYLRTEAAVRWTILLIWITMVGGNSATWVLSAAWARDVLELDAAGWGRLALFWGVGGLLASTVLVTRGDYGRKGALLLAAAGLFAVAVLFFSLTRSVVIASLSFGLIGVAFQIVMTVSMSIVQQVVPNRLLGRVMGLLVLSNGMAQLLGVVIGGIGQAIGLELLYLAIAVGMIAAISTIAATQRPLRTLN